jgi:CRISPR-associated protein Csm3
MTTQWQFKGKYIIQGVIHCATGLHIGGNTEGFEIGGMDNPVIRDPITDQPYIPGSSLKGKLRHLSEWSLGLIDKHPKHKDYSAYACPELEAQTASQYSDPDKWGKAFIVGRLFGPASDSAKVRETAGPTRLAVRDSFLSEASAKNLQQWLGEGIYTEAKTENAIDRVTSEANPRPIERVPAGAEFDFTFIVDIYRDDDPGLLSHLFVAMAMLEDSALGGGGSRGHGQIKFKNLKAEWRSLTYYQTGAPPTPIAAIQGKLVKEIAGFKGENWKV